MIFGGTQDVQPRAHRVYRLGFVERLKKRLTVHGVYCLKMNGKAPRAAPIHGLRGFPINAGLPVRRYTECAHYIYSHTRDVLWGLPLGVGSQWNALPQGQGLSQFGGESMSGKDNLIPGNKRSKEEVRAIGQKGGKASVKARRRKKALREILESCLDMQISEIEDESVRRAIQTAANSTDGSITIGEAIINGLVVQAIKGSPKAVGLIMDTMGESPAMQMKREELKMKQELAKQKLNGMGAGEKAKVIIAWGGKE